MEQYREEREIDFKQLFFYLWDNKITILFGGLVLAVLLAIYSLMGMGESEEPSISEMIETNKKEDPAHQGNTYTTFYVLPNGAYFIESNIEITYNLNRIYNRDNANLSDALNVYKKDASMLALQNSVLSQMISDLDLHQYEDMQEIEARDLSYLLYSICDTSGLLKIQMTDVDAERGKKIVDYLSDRFVENSSMLEAVDDSKILNRAIVVEGKKVEEGGVLSVCKLPVIGFILGIVLMSAIYFVLYILKDAVWSESDIEANGLEVLAKIPCKENKKSDELRRAAYNINLIESRIIAIIPISNDSDGFSWGNELKQGLIGLGKKVSTIDVDSKNIDKLKNDIDKTKNENDIVIITTRSIVESPDSIPVAINSDSIVLLAAYGKTRFKDLCYAVKELGRTGTSIKGVILTDVKYRG